MIVDPRIRPVKLNLISVGAQLWKGQRTVQGAAEFSHDETPQSADHMSLSIQDLWVFVDAIINPEQQLCREFCPEKGSNPRPLQTTQPNELLLTDKVAYFFKILIRMPWTKQRSRVRNIVLTIYFTCFFSKFEGFKSLYSVKTRRKIKV